MLDQEAHRGADGRPDDGADDEPFDFVGAVLSQLYFSFFNFFSDWAKSQHFAKSTVNNANEMKAPNMQIAKAIQIILLSPALLHLYPPSIPSHQNNHPFFSSQQELELSS